MDSKITSANLQAFLDDYLVMSKTELLDDANGTADVLEIAKAKGYVLKGSPDLAGFKTIYTFANKANDNKARLPKDILLKALPSLIGKPVDIDHNRIYVVGHYIDYRYIAKDDMVVAYGVFYKSNFGEEWAKAQQLFKQGKLATSYEIWCPRSKRRRLADGTYILETMEIAGGGLMFREKPAFADAKVLELAKKNCLHEDELVFASKKEYEPEDIITSGTTTFISEVGAPVGQLTPQNATKVLGMPTVEKTSVNISDKIIGKPITTQLPSPLQADAKNLENTGFQPKRIDNDSAMDNVAFPGNQLTWACANCGSAMDGTKLKYTSPDMVTCPTCSWITKASSGRIMLPCGNCNKAFEDMGETCSVALRKNWNDYGVVAGPADGLVPTDLAKREAKCPECKAILNRANGKVLYPPQIIDWNLRCPGCSSNNWKVIKNSPDSSMCQCMSCAKKYALQFNTEPQNPLLKKVAFAYFGSTSCPQCSTRIDFSNSSQIINKSIKCPHCDLTFAHDIRRESQKRQVQKVSAVLEDNMAPDVFVTSSKEIVIKTELPKKFIEILKTLPETGMGYHLVNLILNDKTIIEEVVILNCSIALLKEKLDISKILEVGLCEVIEKANKKDPNESGVLYLVRHGKTKLNDNNVKKDNDQIRGWVNVPLDKEGKQQAKELGEIFKGQKLDCIYSSDLSRAYDTAEQISKSTGTPITTKFDLRPWNLGIHQGESSKKVGPEIAESINKTPNLKVKGGESFNNFKARCLNMARKLLEESKKKQVVAVTHTRAVKLIQAWIKAGCPDDNSIDIKEFMNDIIQTGSIHKIESMDNKKMKVTEVENLNKASIDNTTESSEKGEIKMESVQKKDEMSVVISPLLMSADVTAPTVEAPKAEETVEVEDAGALEQEEELELAKTLTAEDRKKISTDKFAVVKTVKDKKTGGTREIKKYPIHDKAHVQNALARLNQKPSREGLRKLGVSPEAIINKVKAAGRKMGMEVADMDGACNYSSEMEKLEKADYDAPNPAPTELMAKKLEKAENAVAGPDMQKAKPRDDSKTKTLESADKKEGTGNDDNFKSKTDKNNHVAGLTPDQINQMQNQLFSNVKKALRFKKYFKATRANIKALKKAMQEGVYASVQDVNILEDVAENLEITPKEGALSTDRGTGECPKDSVTIGNEAKTQTAGDKNSDTAVNLEANKTANELAAGLTATNAGKTEPVISPAAEVVNAQPTKGAATPISTVSDGKVDNGAKGTGCDVKIDESLMVPIKIGQPSSVEIKNDDKSKIPVTASVEDTAALETAALKNENETLKAKIVELNESKLLLETAAVKILERKNTLGEYGKDLSDKDILDDNKFEVARLKKDNAELKLKLNRSNSRVADTTVTRGETSELSDIITQKAFGIKKA